MLSFNLPDGDVNLDYYGNMGNNRVTYPHAIGVRNMYLFRADKDYAADCIPRSVFTADGISALHDIMVKTNMVTSYAQTKDYFKNCIAPTTLDELKRRSWDEKAFYDPYDVTYAVAYPPPPGDTHIGYGRKLYEKHILAKFVKKIPIAHLYTKRVLDQKYRRAHTPKILPEERGDKDVPDIEIVYQNDMTISLCNLKADADNSRCSLQ